MGPVGTGDWGLGLGLDKNVLFKPEYDQPSLTEFEQVTRQLESKLIDYKLLFFCQNFLAELENILTKYSSVTTKYLVFINSYFIQHNDFKPERNLFISRNTHHPDY